MKICIPSKDPRGLSSEVFDHFGSAPWFTIVDTEEGKVRTIRNPNCHRDEGSYLESLRLWRKPSR